MENPVLVHSRPCQLYRFSSNAFYTPRDEALVIKIDSVAVALGRLSYQIDALIKRSSRAFWGQLELMKRKYISNVRKHGSAGCKPAKTGPALHQVVHGTTIGNYAHSEAVMRPPPPGRRSPARV